MRRYRICPNKFAPMAGDTSHSPTVAVVGIERFLVHPEGERFLCSEVPRPSGFCPRHEHSAAIWHLPIVQSCVALFRFFGHIIFTLWPNKSPEPTTIGAFRDSARVAGCCMSIVRGGSAFFVRRLAHAIKIYANTTKTDTTTIPASITTGSSGASTAETTSTTECSEAGDYSDE